MGRHRIEIEFSDYGNPDAAEHFLARIDAAISTFDWHVTQLEIGMTPVIEDDHRKVRVRVPRSHGPTQTYLVRRSTP